MLRVTEGPFFSEVAAYYEHVHQVVRLYNLPGAPAEEWGGKEVGAWAVTPASSCRALLGQLFLTSDPLRQG